MGNFDLKTFLAENKLTFDSKVISERATDKYKVTCGNHTNKAFAKVVNSNKLTATPYKLKNGFIVNQGDLDVVGKILDREMIPHTIDNIDNKRAELDVQEEVEEQFGGETTSAAAGGFDVLAGYLKAVVKKGGEAGKKAAEFLKTLPAGAGHAMRNEEEDDREDDELTPEELANKHAGSPMHKEELTREEELKAEIRAMFDSSTDEALSELSEKEKVINHITDRALVEAGEALMSLSTNHYKVTFNYEGTDETLVFRPNLEQAEKSKKNLEATEALDGYELKIKKIEREPSKYKFSSYLRDRSLD